MKLIRKKKICKHCHTEQLLFSNGLCLLCYNKLHPTFIKKKSEKKVKEDKEYNLLNKNFLETHRFCEIRLEGCTLKATEVHHSKGRGRYYLDEASFKATCHHCHVLITEHSKDAIEKGHSQSRLKN